MKSMHLKKIVVLFVMLVLIVISCLHPLYPNEMFLQHTATLLCLVFMVADLKKNYISLYAFSMLALFMVFHAIGARWIYSFVPYNQWFEFLSLTNVAADGDSRNHYDRFVHFAYGILFFPIAYELSKKWLGLSFRNAVLFAFLFIQTFSMVYELFEWSLTFMLSPNDVEGYNGQQGDMWDPQKDMALATLGSIVYMFIFIIVRKMKCKRG